MTKAVCGGMIIAHLASNATEGGQGKNSSGKLEAGTKVKAVLIYWIVLHVLLSLLSYTTWDHLLKGINTDVKGMVLLHQSLIKICTHRLADRQSEKGKSSSKTPFPKMTLAVAS